MTEPDNRVMIITVLNDKTGEVFVPPDITQEQLLDALDTAQGIIDTIFHKPGPMVP